MGLRLKGVAAANGIAIAPLVHFHGDLTFIPMRNLVPEEIAGEKDRLAEALTQAAEVIFRLRRELASDLSDHDTRIYDAQLSFLNDQTFRADLERTIQERSCNAEVALQQVIARYEKVFEGMEDAAMRERAADLRDVGRQLLSVLLEKDRSVYISDGKDFVTARGGKYSHGAILARSLGIPAVVAVDDVLQRVGNGTPVVLDGDSGALIVEPDAEETERYRRLALEQAEADRRVFEVRFLSSTTPDGVGVRLMANVEAARDLGRTESGIVDGIGLCRTEFAFMERRQFPNEEEQLAMYRKAIEWADGKIVTFRTLDVGGDKPLAYFRTPEERNPVLGWRGLRISLDWPDLFYTQVRALLRASAGGHARILLPMVTSVEEVARSRAVLEEIKADLAQAGEAHDPDIELGAMVEVPALVDVLDEVLPLVDFLSVGTNDLVQYLLAVDRDNPRIAQMYTPYHPGVIRVLRRIADRAIAHGKPVSICGEIAGDHYFTPILLGLGYRELSMAPVFLPRVKLMVRAFSILECEDMAARALALGHAREIRALARDKAAEGWSTFLEGADS
jgi:phosphotransferase system enzyme I (PtsI)